MEKIFNRYPVQIVMLASVYFVTARLGLLLAYPGTNTTPIWMPTGIALSAFLLLGSRMWPGIALGAFFVNFVHLAGLDLSIPVSLAASFFTSAGNTLEALVGAYLIHRFTGTRNPFERSGDVCAFIVFGALISTTVSATIGASTFCLSISEWRDFATLWLTWWLGDAVGAIVLVPLIMTYKGFAVAAWNFRTVVGNLLLVLLVAAGSYIVFLKGYPLAFLLLPILIILAFRLGQFGSAIAICIMSGFSIYGTVNGNGQFANCTQAESLLLQQGFIGSMAIAIMVLATIIYEQKKSKSKLMESEQYNRLLFELSPIGLALCRMDGCLVDINPAYCSIIGRSVEDTMSLSYWDITPEKYGDQELAQLESLKVTGGYGPYEKEYLHKDGHLVPVRLQGLILQKDGEKFIWSSVEDISERKKTEQTLVRNEQVLRLFVEHAPASIAMFDNQMRYLVVSRRFRMDYNLGDQDIIGRSHYEVFPEISEHWKEVHRCCLAGAVEKCAEDPFPRSDGKVDWVCWEIHPWYENRSDIGGIILFSEVVTERKEAEAALRLSEQKFATTFRNSPEAIALTSATNGQFVDVNESFLRLSGYGREEVIGRTTLDLHFWINPVDRQRYLDLLQESGRVMNMEADFQKKSGEIMNSLVSGECIQVENNTYILTVIHDISERKQVELELKRYRDNLEELILERTKALKESQRALMNIVNDLNLKTGELEEANVRLKELDHLKSMFIASMSHELRTPLNSIIGFTGLIVGNMVGAISDEQRDMLERVSRAGKHLLSLITDVIDIAKIESGKIVPFPEDFDLQALINEAVGQVRAQAGEKGLAIEVHLPEHKIIMYSDRKRLLQCLLNYLSNAVKFSEKGSVLVEVAEAQHGKKDLPEDWLEVSVSDTGIGISKEDMQLLFNSFVRLETPLKMITEGTGLGLYLTKKMTMELLGGMVGAESEEGRGSRFWLRLPLRMVVEP